MPTTQQMIARAEDLERRAQALRLAAAEMTDQAASNKAPLFPGALDQAIALRKQQRATTNGHQNGAGPAQEAAGGAIGGEVDREALIRTTLADGPLSSTRLLDILAEHGEGMSRSWLTKLLGDMRDVYMSGHGHSAVWRLRVTRGPRKKTAPKAHAPEPTVTPRHKKASKKHYSQEIKAQRAASAALLARFNTESALTPLNVGVTAAEMRAIPPLSRYGYIKRKGDGYLRTAKVYTA
jgi:hypothetical protein